MVKQRRKFSSEYKLEAVKLVLEQGYSVSQACASLGVGESVLRRWIKQVKSEQNGIVLVGNKPLTAEQKRIKELEKQVKELQLEKEILKKATAILTSGELKSTKLL